MLPTFPTFICMVPSSKPASNINECIAHHQGMHSNQPTSAFSPSGNARQSSYFNQPIKPASPPRQGASRKREREKEGGVKLTHPACKKRPFCTFFISVFFFFFYIFVIYFFYFIFIFILYIYFYLIFFFFLHLNISYIAYMTFTLYIY